MTESKQYDLRQSGEDDDPENFSIAPKLPQLDRDENGKPGGSKKKVKPNG